MGRSGGKYRLADVMCLGKLCWAGATGLSLVELTHPAACGFPRDKPSWWPVQGLCFLPSFGTPSCRRSLLTQLSGQALAAGHSHSVSHVPTPRQQVPESQVGADSDTFP